MKMVNRLFTFIHPIRHLGEKNYTGKYAFIVTLGSAILLEIINSTFTLEQSVFSVIAIFWFMILIIYFSFRFGTNGGTMAVVITLGYYFYIIIIRDNNPTQVNQSIRSALFLGLAYQSIAFVIGHLKQRIDHLLEQETLQKQHLQIIMKQLPDGLIITDNQGNITHNNDHVKKILHTPIHKGLNISHITSLLHTPNTRRPVQKLQSSWLSTLRSKRTIVNQEYVIKSKNSSDKHITLSITPICNHQGQLIASVMTIRDTTIQKESEQRKDDFINMASHELKTPITSLKLYIKVLENHIKSFPTPKTKQITKSLKDQAEKLQDLAHVLLDVSYIQTGKLKLHKTTFRLDQLISEIITEMQAKDKTHHHQIETLQPLKVHADKLRISQVITNILANAVKYTNINDTINIRLTRSNGHALISVKDNGIGIPKNQHQKIFDRLYQANRTSQKSYPGMGMGLYIAKEIIDKHGGNIWVESKPKKGSNFHFSIPVE